MNDTLEKLRKEIDELDHKLLQILAKRIEIVKKVGLLKNAAGVSVIDEKRKQELLKKIFDKAEKLNLSKEFIGKLYSMIHDHAVEIQKRS